MTPSGLLTRLRLALLGDLGDRPPPTRLEQLEKRLREVTGVWPEEAIFADLLTEVGDARAESGRVDDAMEAYLQASGIYVRTGPTWLATRVFERMGALRPSPTSPYRSDVRPVLFVQHEGRWQRFQQSVIVLGRGAPGRTDLSLRSGFVARRHAVVVLVDGRHVLRDLASTNGTHLVRRAGVALPEPLAITDHLIEHGDEVQVGEFTVRFAFHLDR